MLNLLVCHITRTFDLQLHQSDGPATKENTMNIIYAVIGTFIVIIIVYTIILLAILRYHFNFSRLSFLIARTAHL